MEHQTPQSQIHKSLQYFQNLHNQHETRLHIQQQDTLQFLTTPRQPQIPHPPTIDQKPLITWSPITPRPIVKTPQSNPQKVDKTPQSYFRSKCPTPTSRPFCKVCYQAEKSKFIYLSHNPTENRCPMNKQPHSTVSNLIELESDSISPLNRKMKLDFESPTVDTPSKHRNVPQNEHPNHQLTIDCIIE